MGCAPCSDIPTHAPARPLSPTALGHSPLGILGAFISRKGTRLKMASRRHFSTSPSW